MDRSQRCLAWRIDHSRSRHGAALIAIMAMGAFSDYGIMERKIGKAKVQIGIWRLVG